jgi:GTPase SAR1 family protein
LIDFYCEIIFYTIKCHIKFQFSKGKTFLLNRYVRNSLPTVPIPTIGIEFGTKIVKLENGQKIKAHIWDTAG